MLDEPPGPRPGGGPVEAARRWLVDIVVRHDIAAAWAGTDPSYRLALTQAVIFLNDQHPMLAGHDREDLARDLSVEDPQHPLWPSFAELLAEEFLLHLGEHDVEGWGEAAPRPTAPGHELVLFAPREESPDEPPGMRSQGVLMHLRGDRWLVAGLSERPAVPGWPPDLGY